MAMGERFGEEQRSVPEASAEQKTDLREQAFTNFRRLLGEEPTSETTYKIREWMTLVVSNLQLVADMSDDLALRSAIQHEASNMKMQADVLVDERMNDTEAWKALVGNAKDYMAEILHGPDVPGEAV